MQIDIDLQQITDLPPGWHIEQGWLCLDAPTDEWYLAKDRVTSTSHGTFKD